MKAVAWQPGLATRIGNALGATNFLALILDQFRQAKCPIRIDPVCCRRIDDAGIRVGHQTQGFLGGIIRQAKESNVGFVDQPLAFSHILALVRIDLEQRNIGALSEIFIDPQAGCTFLTIDKDFVTHLES